jgi:hypothetical protein
MNKCNLCKEEFTIESSNITISKNYKIKLKDGRFVCNGCFEALSFMEDLNKPTTIKNKSNKNQITKSKSEFLCINKECNETYSGSICPKCNKPNPLFIKKNKKCKKKKRKK